MKFIKIVLVLSFFVQPLLVYAQCKYRDPFVSLLPEEETATGQRPGEDLGPPPITIEGVLWGTLNPRVIIDGDVYKTGDTLKTIKAEVIRIKQNTVFISYGNKIFEMKAEKKEER